VEEEQCESAAVTLESLVRQNLEISKSLRQVKSLSITDVVLYHPEDKLQDKSLVSHADGNPISASLILLELGCCF
jgi:hypothetical protein